MAAVQSCYISFNLVNRWMMIQTNSTINSIIALLFTLYVLILVLSANGAPPTNLPVPTLPSFTNPSFQTVGILPNTYPSGWTASTLNFIYKNPMIERLEQIVCGEDFSCFNTKVIIDSSNSSRNQFIDKMECKSTFVPTLDIPFPIININVIIILYVFAQNIYSHPFLGFLVILLFAYHQKIFLVYYTLEYYIWIIFHLRDTICYGSFLGGDGSQCSRVFIANLLLQLLVLTALTNYYKIKFSTIIKELINNTITCGQTEFCNNRYLTQQIPSPQSQSPPPSPHPWSINSINSDNFFFNFIITQKLCQITHFQIYISHIIFLFVCFLFFILIL